MRICINSFHQNLLRYTGIAGLAVTSAVGVCGESASTDKPNIVFFLVDDMGTRDTSVLFGDKETELNRRYRTPNMEKMARQGMKFTQAYACAMCTPSRVSLMTGMNQARHKVTCWTALKDKPTDRPNKTIQPPNWNMNGLSREPGVNNTVVAETLPELLRQAGYRTIHVGKAHFAAAGVPSTDPCKLGFDVNIGGDRNGSPGSYYGMKNFGNLGKRSGVPGLEAYHGKDIFLTEALTLEANKAMDQAVADKKPFYLNMAHYAVHSPWQADDRFLKRYTDAGLSTRQAAYASMIEGMDKSLGDIMKHLKKLKIEDNTILVFMADNGSHRALPRNLPLRGAKIDPYEGGVRVPLMVKWPNVVKADTVCKDDYVIIEDIFPTFLEMAGVKKYTQKGGKIDGKSFVPLLKGERGTSKGRAIFWHFPNTYLQTPYSTVRKDDWKLIYYHDKRKFELFNLADDIGETKNLASANPEKRQAMAKLLGAHLRESGALMITDKRTNKLVEFPDKLGY